MSQPSEKKEGSRDILPDVSGGASEAEVDGDPFGPAFWRRSPELPERGGARPAFVQVWRGAFDECRGVLVTMEHHVQRSAPRMSEVLLQLSAEASALESTEAAGRYARAVLELEKARRQAPGGRLDDEEEERWVERFGAIRLELLPEDERMVDGWLARRRGVRSEGDG